MYKWSQYPIKNHSMKEEVYADYVRLGTTIIANENMEFIWKKMLLNRSDNKSEIIMMRS